MGLSPGWKSGHEPRRGRRALPHWRLCMTCPRSPLPSEPLTYSSLELCSIQTVFCYFILQKLFLWFSRSPAGFTQRNAAMPRRVGRPKGEDSTVVNVRLPVSLVQRLDRYLDKLSTETGLPTHRGMILRHALKIVLEAKGM